MARKSKNVTAEAHRQRRSSRYGIAAIKTTLIGLIASCFGGASEDVQPSSPVATQAAAASPAPAKVQRGRERTANDLIPAARSSPVVVCLPRLARPALAPCVHQVLSCTEPCALTTSPHALVLRPAGVVATLPGPRTAHAGAEDNPASSTTPTTIVVPIMTDDGVYMGSFEPMSIENAVGKVFTYIVTYVGTDGLILGTLVLVPLDEVAIFSTLFLQQPQQVLCEVVPCFPASPSCWFDDD